MEYNDFSLIQAQKNAGDPVFGGNYNGELTDRERHLIGLAVATTKGCADCTNARLKAARQAGIPEQVIKEAVNLTAGVNAGFIVQAAVKASKK
jgi:AhpD family alkylhydroperoxidase